MLRVFFFGLVSFFASMPVEAQAAAGDHPDRLLLVLRLIDQVPTKAQLVEAGAGARGEALIRVADDRTLRRYTRVRAAGLLAHFDDAKTRGALRRLVQTSDDVEVRLQALVGLTYAERTAARPLLVKLLNDPNPHLRAAAGRGLVRIKAADRSAVIRARIEQETVPWVRSALHRARRR